MISCFFSVANNETKLNRYLNFFEQINEETVHLAANVDSSETSVYINVHVQVSFNYISFNELLPFYFRP